MINYQIGDFLTQIKNAALAKKSEVETSSSKLKAAVAKALVKEGFLTEVKTEKGNLKVRLSFQDKRPVLVDLKLISKPGRRLYVDCAKLEKKKGPSIWLISTPKGILSSRQARKERVGGEVIAEVW